jgi:hypothetical protein
MPPRYLLLRISLPNGRRLPTVGITSVGAGVGSVQEQEKLEARKMLENAEESPASSPRFVKFR